MKIAVNGFDMNYAVEGPDGAPWLTFANSLVTSLEMWDEQARALRDRYRVLRFDMRATAAAARRARPTRSQDLPMTCWDSGARSGSIAATTSGCRSAA
jgi:pimeloyl-ACP methyl ester carboxylesterase